MRIKVSLYLVLSMVVFLTGCAATNIAYTPAVNINNKEASALVKELSMSQTSSDIKPSNIEILNSLILWENDAIVFATVIDVELLKKSENYLVQINFKGDVFRQGDWFVVYSSDNIDDAKRYIDALSSLIFAGKQQTEIVKSP
jgi:hypothetical protein